MIGEEHRLNVLDHLSQVAEDLTTFILKRHATNLEQNQHMAQLAMIMKIVEDEHQKPILAWWSTLYRLYRKHMQEEPLSNKTRPLIDNQLLMLDVISSFLKKWSHESSAANILLLDLLLVQLNQYERLEEDARLLNIESNVRGTIVYGIKLALGNLFISTSRKALTHYKKNVNSTFNIIELISKKAKV